MRKTRSSINLKKPKIEQKKEQNKQPQQAENYQFTNKTYSKYLNCPICKILMRNPMRLHPCGHTFCLECAPSKGKCPDCQGKVATAQKDLVGQGLINQMTVRCLNQGCPYKGTYEQYKNYHQSQCTLGKGFDQWLRSMKGALDQHKKEEKQRRSSDYGFYSGQGENQQRSNIKSNQQRRPQSPQKLYDFEQDLLQKTLKAQL